MNPNIATERKTGPVTKQGKERTRLNALKTGKYSKLLSELECNSCKRKDYCKYYRENSNCTLRNNIAKSILINNLNISKELKENYKITLSKAIESLMFDSQEAIKWMNLVTKQLETMNKLGIVEEQKISLPVLEVNALVEEFKRQKEDLK